MIEKIDKTLAENPDKLFFSIGEVADLFEVNTSLIRYWEKEFAMIKPQKNKKGNRFFTPKDIRNLHLVYHLVKEKGMTLRGAQKKLRENREDTEHTFAIVNSLQTIRGLLVELKENL